MLAPPPPLLDGLRRMDEAPLLATAAMVALSSCPTDAAAAAAEGRLLPRLPVACPMDAAAAAGVARLLSRLPVAIVA